MNCAFIRRKLRNLRWRRPSTRRELGALGERAAATHLRRGGRRILARNHESPLGEIDLICAEGETIVFVEVKTLTGEEARETAHAVSPYQWSRIERAARAYLARHRAEHLPARFDLITVTLSASGRPRIEHFENAHEARRL